MNELSKLQNLTNKTAFVTGGAGYLGKAICETLAELGANVVVVSRDQEKCESWAKELREKYNAKTLALSADITEPDSIKKVLKVVNDEFNSIDILVNNAWSGKKNLLLYNSYFKSGSGLFILKSF